MIESLGTLAYELVLELLVASALFWVVAKLVLRLLSVSDPAWRVRFLLLPLLTPVAVVPLIHLVVRPLFLGFSPTPLENLMASLVQASPVVAPVFLAMSGVLLLSAAVHALRPLVAATGYRLAWQRQRRRSALWLQCDRMLHAVAPRLQMPPPRLILTKGGSCGSIAVSPFGSYIVLSPDLASVLDDEELEALFAHELGHIRRKDTLQGTVAGVCRCLLAFSPFAQSTYRSFAWAREEAVDDLAVRASGRSLALASCLVKACRHSQDSARYAPGSGLLSYMSAADRRIRRLLKTPTDAAMSPRWCHWAFCGVIASVVTFLLFAL